jgi:hypothetical protein
MVKRKKKFKIVAGHYGLKFKVYHYPKYKPVNLYKNLASVRREYKQIIKRGDYDNKQDYYDDVLTYTDVTRRDKKLLNQFMKEKIDIKTKKRRRGFIF